MATKKNADDTTTPAPDTAPVAPPDLGAGLAALLSKARSALARLDDLLLEVESLLGLARSSSARESVIGHLLAAQKVKNVQQLGDHLEEAVFWHNKPEA